MIMGLLTSIGMAAAIFSTRAMSLLQRYQWAAVAVNVVSLRSDYSHDMYTTLSMMQCMAVASTRNSSLVCYDGIRCVTTHELTGPLGQQTDPWKCKMSLST